jgi:hypothetical protein
MDTKKAAVSRRRFFEAAVGVLAATQLGTSGTAFAQAAAVPANKPGTNTSLGPLKQVEAGFAGFSATR